MNPSGESGFPWRAAILGPLTVLLFAFALYFYNDMQPELGLALLGVTFMVPLVWVILAAREAEYSDVPMRNFVPRMTAWLVLGAALLGFMYWNVDRRISAMETLFVLIYVGAAFAALRILNSKARRPQLTALSGGNIERRQRPRAKKNARG